MKTTPYPFRAGLRAMVISMCLAGLSQSGFSQLPTVTVRFANPQYICATGQYCVDVEFQSDTDGVEIFGMNVRLFYDDAVLELAGFSDFQGGYGPVSPDPPDVTSSGAGIGYSLFGFGDPGTGVADFVNGAIQLLDDSQPAILLTTTTWEKLYRICFTIDDPNIDSTNFCPSIVWDLEQDPANDGFLIGDDGVVITLTDPDPMVMSQPSNENVVQFNWQYVGAGAPPYGEPIETECINLACTPVIVCPGDVTIECTASTAPGNTGTATAEEVCESAITVTSSDVTVAGNCANNYTITRTWIATNDCDLADTCIQVITITDSVAPSLVCPADMTIGAEESTAPLNTGTATASDNCDATPSVTSGDDIVPGMCSVNYTILRTWTATDACGNSSSCLQTIVVDGDCLVDLALTKTLNGGQGNIEPNDNVAFTIIVTNEGAVSIGAIHLVDYIPVGFTLNDPFWTAGMEGSTGQSASIILSVANGRLPVGGLQPGGNVSIGITLHVNSDIPPGQYANVAEIAQVFDIDGSDVTNDDVDSQPDTDDTNDPPGEDDIDSALICIFSEPVVLGKRFICPNQSNRYVIESYNPEHTYIWEVPVGVAFINDSDSSIVVFWPAQLNGPITITLTDIFGDGCQTSTDIIIFVEGEGPIACHHHLNISIDNACGTVITSGLILTGEDVGDDNYEVIITDQNGNIVPDATFTYEHVGQTFNVAVRSRCNGQSCWGTVTVEDKFPPIINCVCPDGNESEFCEITCLLVDDFLEGDIPEEFLPTVVDNCGGTVLEIVNVEVDFQSCSVGFVHVTWKATDEAGNMSTCIQEFRILPVTIETIEFPAHFEGDCGDSSHPDFTGWPKVNGVDLTEVEPMCNILVSYTDVTIPLCGGGIKIIRSWRVMDWCIGRTIESVQTIKLYDRLGPELVCPPDIETGTDVWFCYANVIVPRPIAFDACSGIQSYTLTSPAGNVVVVGNTHTIHGLPIGTHTVTWTVGDLCGNFSTCTLQITVVDNVPPVVSCDLHTIVSLTSERANGVTLVHAASFDNGSFDNCGPVSFRARRMDSCIDFDWTTEGACVDDIPGGIPPVSELDLGTAFASCVPFACCDIGQPGIMIQLEVTDEAGNINYCMVEVEVQDKIGPELTCPGDIIVSCDFFLDVQTGTFRDQDGNRDGSVDEDPLSAIFGNLYDAFNHEQADRQIIIVNDPDNPEIAQPANWGIEGWAQDNCQLDLWVIVTITEDCSGAAFNGQAPPGAVKLIQRRFFANDGTSTGSCLQRIWVVDYNRFYISDVDCLNADPLDGVIWPCDIMVFTCPDDIGDTGAPIVFDDGCSIIGMTYEDTRFDFADDACFKIFREWKILDWCQFNPNTGYGLWTYTQVIKVVDSEGVQFLNAPTSPVSYCLDDPGITLPTNNQVFLGEGNPLASSCSVHVDLGLTIFEACSGTVSYDVRVYPFNGSDFIQMVPVTQVILNADRQAEIRFNTKNSSLPAISQNGLPYTSSACGEHHRVVWTVTDGCGNINSADYLFRLVDCKDPTPVCLNGVSTVIMSQGGSVTIWASDFNASSFDDCTPGASLLYSFSGDVYQPSFTYTCDNVPAFGVQIPEEIWVADEGVDQNCNGQISWNERNKAFCVTYIIITDPSDACENGEGILEGEIKTEHADAVSLVTMRLSDSSGHSTEIVTGQDGRFSFSHVPPGTDYMLEPGRNDDHRNGVSTLDLVHIQKHLLGVQPFTSPYQFIAADANNSQSVSAIDLIEIRKLILGIQHEFTGNQSWRFVEKGSDMAPGHPWPFNEYIEVLQVPVIAGSNFDFVGVKIGDVNNTVKANAMQVTPRGSNRVMHVKASVRGKMDTGEEIEVELRFPELVSGFQWTLETSGLEYVGITSDKILIGDQHVGLLSDGVITMSWNEDALPAENFTTDMSIKLKFRVTEPGSVIDMLRLTSQVTSAEAYTPEDEILDVKLSFSSTGVFTDFALFQNRPNPWNHQTRIGFHLPEAAEATLTVYDVSGKVVKQIQGAYPEGYNSIILHARELPSTGILYYRLDSGEYSATKKMVLME